MNKISQKCRFTLISKSSENIQFSHYLVYRTAFVAHERKMCFDIALKKNLNICIKLVRVYSTNACTASLSGVLMGMVDTVLADIKVKPFRVKQARIHNSILY